MATTQEVLADQIQAVADVYATQAKTLITPVYNVNGYVSCRDGSADIAAELQSVYDMVSSVGGGVVYYPQRAYRVDSTIDVPANVTTLMAEGAYIDASNMADGDYVFSVAGAQGTSTTLAADASEGDTSVTVASAAGFAVGDWCLLKSDAVTGSTGNKKGELVQISSVSGTTITLYNPLADAYATADMATLVKLYMKENVHFKGVTIKGGTDSAVGVFGIVFDICKDVSVLDCRFFRTHDRAVAFYDTTAFRVSNCHFEDIRKTGLAYGVAVAYASQDGVISNCTGLRLRHLVSTGGSASRHGVTRRITGDGCTASQMIDAGFDAHPGSEDITYTDCHVHGSENDGIVMQCARYIVKGCTIRNVTRHGILAQYSSTRDLEAIIANNNIRKSGNRGISIEAIASYSNYKALVVEGNVITKSGVQGLNVVNGQSFYTNGIKIRGNIIRHEGNSHALYVQKTKDVDVSGNTVEQTYAGAETVYLTDVADGTVAGNILVGNLTTTRGIRVVGGTDMEIIGNRVRNAATGIMLDNTSSYCVVMGNNLRGCTTPLSMGTGQGHIYQTAANDAYNRT